MKYFILVLNLIITFKPPTKQKIVTHTSVKISQHLPMTDVIHWDNKQKGGIPKRSPRSAFFLHTPVSHNLVDASSDILRELYSS